MTRKLSLLLLLVFISMAGTWAQVSKNINYSGTLYDNNGQPIVDGDQSLTFNLYKVSAGGTPIWTETQTVTTVGGDFSALLGSVTPFPDTVDFSTDYWLGLTLNAGTEYAPRIKFTPSPYSIKSSGLVLPFAQSTSKGIAGGATFDLRYTGVDSVQTMYIESNNNGQANALQVVSKGNGGGGSFVVENSEATYAPVYAKMMGKGSAVVGDNYGTDGRAATFIIRDANNARTGLLMSTAGTGNAGWFQSTNTANNKATLGAYTKGTSHAGMFLSDNANSDFATLYTESKGTGPGIFSRNYGTGVGGSFTVENEASEANALYASTNGTGSVISAETATGWAVIQASSNGSGSAIDASNNGTADGFAGLFANTNAGNAHPAIQASTVGTGPGLRVFQDANSAGSGIDINMLNANSNAIGLSVGQDGLGDAASFTISNASNTATALYAESKGTGPAANFKINNTASPGAAILAETNGDANSVGIVALNSGQGYAGKFEIWNASSTGNALKASTDGTGTSLEVNHLGTSGEIAVFQSDGVNVARIDKAGVGYFNGGTVSSGADLAEAFDVEGLRASYEPGDVLVISETSDRSVEKSNTANSTRVVGVYATKPGVLLTEKDIDTDLSEMVPMGVVGVIPTKVSGENGPIKRGDLLVTSSTPGHAMKAQPIEINGHTFYPSGIILGKALENFDGSGTGLIKVMVNVK